MTSTLSNNIQSFTQEFVESKLQEIGAKLLKKPYVNHWRQDNCTYGYCYVVSEAFYHYLDEANVHAYCLNLGDDGTHWYLKVNDEWIDFTHKQFNYPINYAKGVRKGFFKGSVKTKRGYISKRGYEMAKHLGLTTKHITEVEDEGAFYRIINKTDGVYL